MNSIVFISSSIYPLGPDTTIARGLSFVIGGIVDEVWILFLKKKRTTMKSYRLNADNKSNDDRSSEGN